MLIRSFQFSFVALGVSALLTLVACSQRQLSGNMSAITENKPASLTPSVPQQVQSPAYEILRVRLSAVETGTGRLTAMIRVRHFGVEESIGLFGTIGLNGRADLVELHAPAPNLQRITASLFCADENIRQSCELSIVNVFYRLGGHNHLTQFVAPALQNVPTLGGTPNEITNNNPQPVSSEEDDMEDEDPDQPSSVTQHGQYVGAGRNEIMISRLANHSTVAGGADEPQTGSNIDTSIDAPEVVNVTAPPTSTVSTVSPTPQVTVPAPATAPTTPSVSAPATAPATAPAPPPSPDTAPEPATDPAPPASPEPVSSAPPNQPASQPPSEPVTTAPPSAPAPSVPDEPPVPDDEAPPPLPAPGAEPEVPTSPSETATQNSDVERQIAPLVDFHSGGQAVDFYSHGTLSEASLFPAHGPGYDNHLLTTTFGTGMLVSLLQNGARQFVQMFPGFQLNFGSLALQHGGRYTGHASHQNGLDVDIRYVGTSGPGSVVNLRTQAVTSNFHPEQVWAFMRLIASQKMIEHGRQRSILDRIFVHPVVKSTLCSWGNRQHLFDDPLNHEIMTRLRPTAQTARRNGRTVATTNHHDHFHVRLHCSPYYSRCRNMPSDPNVFGCAADQ